MLLFSLRIVLVLTGFGKCPDHEKSKLGCSPSLDAIAPVLAKRGLRMSGLAFEGPSTRKRLWERLKFEMAHAQYLILVSQKDLRRL